MFYHIIYTPRQVKCVFSKNAVFISKTRTTSYICVLCSHYLMQMWIKHVNNVDYDLIVVRINAYKIVVCDKIEGRETDAPYGECVVAWMQAPAIAV